MAVMTSGYMGGFSGRLGPAIGYLWNGKWCLRSRPAQVRNPRTPEQVAHRTLFREEVRLAARMRLGVAQGFTAMARQMGMTCFNLFVSLNQSAFSLQDERLVVDYQRLRLSSGPVAPVAFTSAVVDENNVVNIEFEKNPLRVVADGYDQVKVYVYCPDLEEDYLSAPVYRRDRRLRFVLPDEFAGHEVHLYGIVQDDEGMCAESAYIVVDVVPKGLRAFVEGEVLPRYRDFDAAHGVEHARRVMARAMQMEATPAVYAAAAMHDLGLAEGREEHHLASGRIVRACGELRQWFSEEEVEAIAQAVEDHRASATRPPRSRLGCIIAEADRDIEPETIVRRTVEYGLSHYPELDKEGHWQRTLEHLHEKYAEGGYLKLWMEDSPNAAPLAELRRLIGDEERLRTLFERYFRTA